MLATLLPIIVRALAPKAPEWVLGLLIDGIPAIFDIVETLQETELAGADKFELATREVAEAFDEALDGVPAWSDITEARRDRIIGGLVELIVFIAVDAQGLRKPRKTRRDFRRLWAEVALRAANKES
jgi:hypothetical protein